MNFERLPSDMTIDNTVAALRNNNIEAIVVGDGEEAYKKVFELIPENAEIMNMTSMTLEAIGVSKDILESGRYRAVRNELNKMDRKTHNNEMQKLGSAPEWVVGSVHAVTEDGHVLIASKTGSQLSAYVYGATRVVWVVGAQKIVKDLETGMQRIYEHSLPLEQARIKKLTGREESSVNKILIVNRELTPNRITMIIVNQVLGF